MDLNRVKRLRLNLSAHFSIIACLTAMLVATGSGTYFLPVFILLVTVAAFLFVDCLEWFELKSIGSAVGMILATGVAITTYVVSVFNDSESGQLLAVAGLLVYPEAVLFLQKKTLRIYEQLAVFLLLEMIVAALVNDNVVFGVLLAPIMLLWVSSLFLFSRYATLVKIDASIEKPLPKLAELLFQRFMKSVLGETRRKKIVSSRFMPDVDVQSSSTLRRALQSIPIGIGAILFAGLFFYLLPRTNSGSLGATLKSPRSVGLPETLTFGQVGRILQDPTPVMRVTVKDPESGVPKRLETPPYLRAKVLDRYASGPRRGSDSHGEWGFGGALYPQRLPDPYAIRRRMASRFELSTQESDQRALERLTELGRDILAVEFDMRPNFKSVMFTIPPTFRSPKAAKIPIRYDDLYMVIQKRDNTGIDTKKSTIYEIVSGGFQKGRQVSVTPAKLTRNPADLEQALINHHRDLTRGFESFRRADQQRLSVLRQQRIDESQKLAAAVAFEQELAFSGRFTYSLDLSPPTDSDLDPLEDFIVRQRVGHCQYFASAMVCWLRQTGIPSRLVIGYRPTEYNNLGNYFLVRQNDAHAWVEALFTHEQLEKNGRFRSELTDSSHYWVRFDPTPPPDGELTVTDQQGQAMDYAEKLWREYVVEGQNISSENSIYAPVAEEREAYEQFLQRLTEWRDYMRRNPLFSGRLGFAWPVAIAIILLGAAALLLWQVIRILPRVAPQLASKLGLGQDNLQLQYPFYSRCLSLIGRMGLRRGASTTPMEFTDRAAEALASKGQTASSSLDYLTGLYYRLRFGKKNLPTEQELAEVDRELRKLENAISVARKSS